MGQKLVKDHGTQQKLFFFGNFGLKGQNPQSCCLTWWWTRLVLEGILEWHKILDIKNTSNDIIAGNGRILKVYLFIVQLYLFKEISLQRNGMAVILKIIFKFLFNQKPFSAILCNDIIACFISRTLSFCIELDKKMSQEARPIILAIFCFRGVWAPNL